MGKQTEIPDTIHCLGICSFDSAKSMRDIIKMADMHTRKEYDYVGSSNTKEQFSRSY